MIPRIHLRLSCRATIQAPSPCLSSRGSRGLRRFDELFHCWCVWSGRCQLQVLFELCDGFAACFRISEIDKAELIVGVGVPGVLGDRPQKRFLGLLWKISFSENHAEIKENGPSKGW